MYYITPFNSQRSLNIEMFWGCTVS